MTTRLVVEEADLPDTPTAAVAGPFTPGMSEAAGLRDCTHIRQLLSSTHLSSEKLLFCMLSALLASSGMAPASVGYRLLPETAEFLGIMAQSKGAT